MKEIPRYIEIFVKKDSHSHISRYSKSENKEGCWYLVKVGNEKYYAKILSSRMIAAFV